MTYFARIIFVREWPSGLRCCTENQKDLGSNPTRCSTKVWDPMKQNSNKGKKKDKTVTFFLSLAKQLISF